jgi:hypothetical protein
MSEKIIDAIGVSLIIVGVVATALTFFAVRGPDEKFASRGTTAYYGAHRPL